MQVPLFLRKRRAAEARDGSEAKDEDGREAYTLRVFDDEDLCQRVEEAYRLDTTPTSVVTVDSAARIHVVSSMDVFVPGSVKKLERPLRVVWGGDHSMTATHVGDLQVQGLYVQGAYFVDGFGKNLLSTVALRKQ